MEYHRNHRQFLKLKFDMVVGLAFEKHLHSLHSVCKPYPFIHFKYACWSRHDSWKNAQVRYNNYEELFKYLQLMSPVKTIIWPWGQRSWSHEGHYGTRHAALWLFTHRPNIIDLSGKTKKVMVRTSFAEKKRRRSGRRRRKNQTKTICLPSFEGET